MRIESKEQRELRRLESELYANAASGRRMSRREFGRMIARGITVAAAAAAAGGIAGYLLRGTETGGRTVTQTTEKTVTSTTTVAAESTTTTAEHMAQLTYADFSVSVKTSPLEFDIMKMGKQVLRRVPADRGGFSINGKWKSFSDVKITASDKGRTELSCEGEGANVSLILELNQDSLRVSWIKQGEPLEAISDRWVAPEGVHWYGQGQLSFQAYPLDSATGPLEMRSFLADNIQVPFWLTQSGAGILIDTYQSFATVFDKGLTVTAMDTDSFVYHVLLGATSKEARSLFLRRVGLPERIPPKEILAKPIFTTWVAFKKDVDQEKVISFARGIREHDFPCSAVAIDDKWEENYGDFTFDKEKFPDPRKMVDELHDMGYSVTLWVYPFINRESGNFELARDKGYLVIDPYEDEPAHVRWWDGTGGLIDISNPEAVQWYDSKLNSIKNSFGFDGFKFDAGDGVLFPLAIYSKPLRFGRTFGGLTPSQYTDAWLSFIASHHYPLAEARVGFLAQRFGVVAREGDKDSRWGLDNGLHAAITQGLTLSITGYPFIMPDMIGGNQYTETCERELFIRWAEAASLFPVVEYSIPPWSFDEEVTLISRSYSLLHLELEDYYLSLAKAAQEQGISILSPFFLGYPEDEECYRVDDEFLIGDLLVAPVIKKGSRGRSLYLPRGSWTDFWSGKTLEGPAHIDASAELDTLPLFAASTNSELVRSLRLAKSRIFQAK